MLLAGLVAVPACSGDGRNQAGADERSGREAPAEVRIGITGPIEADPAVLNPTRSMDVLAADLLFDGLTDLDASGAVVPEIASSWSTADGIVWTFQLDPGRRFSNGADILAADVVASLDRVVGRATESVGAARLDGIVGFAEVASGATPHLAGVATADHRTLTITLSAANYELPALLADPTFGIVAGDAVMASQTAVSGRYRVQSGGADGATLVPVDGAHTKVDGVEFVRFDTVDLAAAALAAGDLDVAPLDPASPSPSGDSVEVRVSGATLLLEFGTTGRWGSADARRAVRDVLDLSAVASAADADVASGLVPGRAGGPGGCVDSCGVTPERTALLAAVAGSGPVQVAVVAGAVPRLVAEEVARQLGAAGLPAEVVEVDAGSLEASLAAGALDLVVFPVVGSAPTPDPYVSAVLSSLGKENLSGFASASVDGALGGARSQADAAARSDAYSALEVEGLGEAPVVPLVAAGERYVVSGRVQLGGGPRFGVLFDGDAVSLTR